MGFTLTKLSPFLYMHQLKHTRWQKYHIFYIELESLDNELKYLGFVLQPNKYGICDWIWIFDKFERKLYSQSHKWLTLGCRRILAQLVLQTISICQIHLYILPKFVIKKINYILSNFIWFGSKGVGKMHLAQLEDIKEEGSQGIKNTKIFRWSLLVNSFWKELFGYGLWQQIIKEKYLHNQHFHTWIKVGTQNTCYSSFILNNFMLIGNMQWRLDLELRWRLVWTQSRILWKIALFLPPESSISMTRVYIFSIKFWLVLILFSKILLSYALMIWACMGNWSISRINMWFIFIWQESLWRISVILLNGMVRKQRVRSLLRIFTGIFLIIINDMCVGDGSGKYGLGTLVFWVACLENKILTWEILCRRGFYGLDRCCMCNNDNKDVIHLFLICPYAISILTCVLQILIIKAN